LKKKGQIDRQTGNRRRRNSKEKNYSENEREREKDSSLTGRPYYSRLCP